MPTQQKLLFPFLMFFVAAITIPAAGACQSKSIAFELYPASSNMGRTDLTHDETATARPVVVKQGARIFQVLVNKRTGHELFRVSVGTAEATYWVYGLVREADFNGDGIPDFSWHGGDDTSDLNLVALSSSTGYKKLDTEASLRRQWRRQFPSDPQEESLIGGVIFSDMKLVRESEKLLLEGIIRFSNIPDSDGVKLYEHRLRVREQNFMYVK